MLKKTNKYQTLLAVCLLTLSACSTNETLTDSPIDQGKTPIELSVGIVGENTSTPRALTRTVITNDDLYGHAATAFENATSLYMVLKSEYSGTGAAQDPKYSRSIGTVPGSGGTNPLNVSFASGYQRYWEDSYSRDSKVSVYSACVPGYTSTVLNIAGTDYNEDNYTWSTIAITPNIAWPLSGTAATQIASFLSDQDLCFSNNVSNLGTDNRIAFDTSTKKFTSKEMIFHHALTKVTFKIKKGNGFGSDPFAFTTPDKNIVLKGFNSSGTLDISTGEFGSIGTTDITYLADTKTSDDATEGYIYVLTGLMLPGSVLTSTATDEVYFTIDNNKYHITKSQLATALNSKTVGSNSTPALTDDKKMRPGVHYVFTMTVSKSQISNLSAAVVGWETVTADEMAPSNARISVSLLNNGTAESGEASFDLLRSPNVYDGETIDDTWASYAWAKDYEKATLSYNSTTGAYVAYNLDGITPWYWPNNRTFYHFRTLKPQTTTGTWEVTLDGINNVEYVTLTGAAAGSYRDVCWGAPFNSLESGQKLTYSLTTGFDNTTGTSPNETHQISKAIGPTTSTIKMNTFHMMSDVTFILTTPSSPEAADYSSRVDLNNAKMELVVHNTGRVLMGNGLVETTGSTTTITNQINDTPTYTGTPWHYGFVPQSLDPNPSDDADDVILIITTSDNNQYKVTLKNVKFTASSFNNNLIANPYTVVDGKCKINQWYPNFSYTYTFHLTKTGIEKVTATLAAWGAVTADPQTVQIQ